MIKTKKIIGCKLFLYDDGKVIYQSWDEINFDLKNLDKLEERKKRWLSESPKHSAKQISVFETVNEIRELFYVDKKVGKRMAKRLVKEEVEKKKIDYDTPWSTYITIDSPEEIRLELWKGLALNILAHFNTGRDKEYFLYGIISQ